MNEPTKRVTREELYNEVWKTPVTKLAAAWGVTQAAIQRACKRLNVPRPAAGHWQLVRRGWEMEREPLPAAGTTVPAETVIGWKWQIAAQPTRVDEKRAKVEVSEDLRALHPLVRDFKRRLEKAEVIAHGPLDVAGEAGDFDVFVSPAQLRRTLLILDALVRELEARGCRFVPKGSKAGPYQVETKDGTVEFRIWEKMSWEQVLVRQEPRPGGHINHFEHRYKTAGKLTFTLEEYYPIGGRKNWSDGERQRLEEKVGDIVEQIIVNPAEAREDHERRQKEAEESRRQWYEEYLRSSAPERLKELRKEIADQVEQRGQEWVRARGIRDFLAACEGVMRDGKTELAAESWERQWLGWSQDWVNRIDPLTNGFLDRLREQFEELRDLEAFVKALPVDDRARAESEEPE